MTLLNFKMYSIIITLFSLSISNGTSGEGFKLDIGRTVSVICMFLNKSEELLEK